MGMARGDPHLGGTESSRGGERQQPDGARAEHQHALSRADAAPFERVHDHRHRLRERGELRVEIIRHAVHAFGRHHDVLRESARQVHAVQLRAAADRVRAALASRARTAATHRLDRNARPDGDARDARTERVEAARRLVPRRRAGREEAAAEQVQVAAADAAGLDRDAHFAGSRFGNRHARDLDFAASTYAGSTHLGGHRGAETTSSKSFCCLLNALAKPTDEQTCFTSWVSY